LALGAGVLIAGAGATAAAFALDGGPVPKPEGLAQAIQGALQAQPVQGLSATIQYTNTLLEGASLASGPSGSSGLASSPLLQGGSGRLWVSANGQARLELQTSEGDTQVVLDHNTVSIYGAAPNTVYRYTLPAQTSHSDGGDSQQPSVAQIEKAIARAQRRATISGAEPTDVAGQAAYAVRISPKEKGSLLGAVELAWDAVHGVPLRAAVYSTGSASPVIELAVSEVTYGPVESSVFEISPPPGSTVTELAPAKTRSGTMVPMTPVAGAGQPGRAPGRAGIRRAGERSPGKITKHGQGLSAVVVDEITETGAGGSGSGPLAGLPTVSINGSTASELATALGTILSFERSGVRYVVAGAVAPAAVQEVARGL
jgi:outer membrane lipoprotein-sorting protein